MKPGDRLKVLVDWDTEADAGPGKGPLEGDTVEVVRLVGDDSWEEPGTVWAKDADDELWPWPLKCRHELEAI